MIKVTARQTVKEGKLEEYLSMARKLVEETNKNDAGCIRYELFQDMSDPQTVTMFEEWADQASLDKHMSASHFQEFAPKLDEMCSKQVDINLYTKLF